MDIFAYYRSRYLDFGLKSLNWDPTDKTPGSGAMLNLHARLEPILAYLQPRSLDLLGYFDLLWA